MAGTAMRCLLVLGAPVFFFSSSLAQLSRLHVVSRCIHSLRGVSFLPRPSISLAKGVYLTVDTGVVVVATWGTADLKSDPNERVDFAGEGQGCVCTCGWPLIWPPSPNKRTSRIAAGRPNVN